MSKSKEELNKLKEEVEAVNEKLSELTEEEIVQVTGGMREVIGIHIGHCRRMSMKHDTRSFHWISCIMYQPRRR